MISQAVWINFTNLPVMVHAVGLIHQTNWWGGTWSPRFVINSTRRSDPPSSRSLSPRSPYCSAMFSTSAFPNPGPHGTLRCPASRLETVSPLPLLPLPQGSQPAALHVSHLVRRVHLLIDWTQSEQYRISYHNSLNFTWKIRLAS